MVYLVDSNFSMHFITILYKNKLFCFSQHHKFSLSKKGFLMPHSFTPIIPRFHTWNLFTFRFHSQSSFQSSTGRKWHFWKILGKWHICWFLWKWHFLHARFWKNCICVSFLWFHFVRFLWNWHFYFILEKLHFSKNGICSFSWKWYCF